MVSATALRLEFAPAQGRNRRSRATDCGAKQNRSNKEVPVGAQREIPEYEEYLYRCYVRYMTDAKQALLGVLENEGWRAHFRRVHHVLTLDEFRSRLADVAAQPERYRELAQLLRDGYAARVSRERDGFRTITAGDA